MELSRRRFVQFLAAAPVAMAFDPHRKIFDMGRNRIWTPPPVEIISAQMPEWYVGDVALDIGQMIDFSINAELAKYSEKMEQTYVWGYGDQRFILATHRKPSLQV